MKNIVFVVYSIFLHNTVSAARQWLLFCVNAAILYELLYDGVFKVDRSVLGSCQRGGRHTDLLTDDNMAACGSSDESDGDAGEALW